MELMDQDGKKDEEELKKTNIKDRFLLGLQKKSGKFLGSYKK